MPAHRAGAHCAGPPLFTARGPAGPSGRRGGAPAPRSSAAGSLPPPGSISRGLPAPCALPTARPHAPRAAADGAAGEAPADSPSRRYPSWCRRHVSTRPARTRTTARSLLPVPSGRLLTAAAGPERRGASCIQAAIGPSRAGRPREPAVRNRPAAEQRRVGSCEAGPRLPTAPRKNKRLLGRWRRRRQRRCASWCWAWRAPGRPPLCR